MCSSMVRVLRHRGPDEEGGFRSPRCVLGMCRLAIQDVLHGHQPVFNEQRTIAAVFNGEIYNFRELRRALEERGHKLDSLSDSEVIPHLYEDLGDSFLHELRGMFAIALWDEAGGRLLVARDRLGKKPLYFHRAAGRLTFASEIKALFVDPSIPREPDFTAIHQYLCLQYVPAPRTAFAGIQSLPPGHLMVFQDGTTTIEQWWSLERQHKLELSEEEEAVFVRNELHEATALRLVADVPVGAFLSGGVDSACVVASMAAQSTDPVRTFTIGFNEEERDERDAARLVAQTFGTDHTEHLLEPDVLGMLPILAWHFDQPLGDHAILPTYAIAQQTRRHVTVALNGDGGDEAFAGYSRVASIRDGYLRSAIGTSVDRLERLFIPRTAPGSPITRMGRGLIRRYGTLESAYGDAVQVFPEPWLQRVYLPTMREAASSGSVHELLSSLLPSEGDPVWRSQIADYTSYLPGALLPKVDLAAMAVSLEVRSPMLDHVFVEQMSRLPSARKVASGTKTPLRNAFRGIVPDEILDGAKRGFGLPLDRWFRTDLLPVARAMLLRDSCITRYVISHSHVKSLVESHATAKTNDGARLFVLLMLELWFRTYIDQPPPLQAPAEVSLLDLS